MWALRSAALALGIVESPDDFTPKEGDSGGTYQGFDGTEPYNRTLDALEALGFDTGRERVGDRESGQIPNLYHDVDLGALTGYTPGDDPREDAANFARACLEARDSGEVDLSDAEPPYRALVGLADAFELTYRTDEDRALGILTPDDILLARNLFEKATVDDLS